MTDKQILINASGSEGNNYYKIYEQSCRAWVKSPTEFMIWAGEKYWLWVHKDEPYYATTGTIAWKIPGMALSNAEQGKISIEEVV